MAGIWFPICRCNRSSHLAGVAKGDHAIRDVVIDETARAYDDVAADRDTGKNNAVSAKPNIAADMNRQCDLEILIPKRGVQRVQRRIKRAVRPDEDVISKYDFSGIDKNAVVVHEEILANLDIEPEPAEQVWLNIKPRARFSKERPDDCFSCGEIGRPCMVIVIAQIRTGEVSFLPSGKERVIG
ncbi:hypothetical protein SDC9_114607 [bioreactor metagenome]|uniref:Uncharacterized protein n=1 Tax=bioreactor metagenome TaxID=1076179 RepID=A0A645BX33_9ZZZZ